MDSDFPEVYPACSPDELQTGYAHVWNGFGGFLSCFTHERKALGELGWPKSYAFNYHHKGHSPAQDCTPQCDWVEDGQGVAL